jgi:hypothetical protein
LTELNINICFDKFQRILPLQQSDALEDNGNVVSDEEQEDEVCIKVPQKRMWPEGSGIPRMLERVAAGLVQITHQCWVNHIETITESELPESWLISEDSDSIAYIIDLTSNCHEYKEASEEPLGIAAIIKNKVLFFTSIYCLLNMNNLKIVH